jgi:hypothetical protein
VVALDLTELRSLDVPTFGEIEQLIPAPPMPSNAIDQITVSNELTPDADYAVVDLNASKAN